MAMTDEQIQEEVRRLGDAAHVAYGVLLKALSARADETKINHLKDEWQAKHRLWWTFVQRQMLKKPGIIFTTIDLAGPDPLG